MLSDDDFCLSCGELLIVDINGDDSDNKYCEKCSRSEDFDFFQD